MKRLPMRKIREALRLRADGFSGRQVAQSLSLGRATISDYFRRAEIVSLGWPLPNDLSDGDLERLLFPRSAGDVQGSYPQPDWALVHRELRRKGVMLALLWEEYRAVHPDGYGDSRFCELYNPLGGPSVAGHAPAPPCRGAAIRGLCRDDDRCRLPETGEVRSTQLFVAALGASNDTYVEATWSQKLSDWISSHARAFTFFGGVPAQVVSDNLKAGVTKACFYDPAINRTYADMAVLHQSPDKRGVPLPVKMVSQLTQTWHSQVRSFC